MKPIFTAITVRSANDSDEVLFKSLENEAIDIIKSVNSFQNASLREEGEKRVKTRIKSISYNILDRDHSEYVFELQHEQH